MRRLIFPAVILIILVIGGGLTAQLATREGIGGVLPVLQTVGNASGSTLELTSQKAELLFLLIGFLIFNIVGIAATLAAIFWFLHRGVKIAETIEVATPKAEPVKARAAK